MTRPEPDVVIERAFVASEAETPNDATNALIEQNDELDSNRNGGARDTYANRDNSGNVFAVYEHGEPSARSGAGSRTAADAGHQSQDPARADSALAAPVENSDSGSTGSLPESLPELPESLPEPEKQGSLELPELPEIDDAALRDLIDSPSSGNDDLIQLGWRYEVTNAGRYFIYRKGSKKARVTRRGGRFDQLPEYRQAEYRSNVARRNRNAAGTPRNPTE